MTGFRATPADVTDRDAAREVLLRLCPAHPEITPVWADQGYWTVITLMTRRLVRPGFMTPRCITQNPAAATTTH